MILRKWGLLALGLAFSAAGTSPAGAQAVQVERSGNTYHVAVCARGNPNGTARCHSPAPIRVAATRIASSPAVRDPMIV